MSESDMSVPTPRLPPAFLGDDRLHARYLARALEVAAHNAGLFKASVSNGVPTAPDPAVRRSTRAGAGAVVAPGPMPSLAALEAAAAEGGSSVGRPTIGPSPAVGGTPASVRASTTDAPSTSPSSAAGRPRSLWSAEEMQADDFFPLQLGLPAVLAELLGEFSVSPLLLHRPGFAVEAMQTMSPGADLARVASAFVAWMFRDAEAGVLRLSMTMPLQQAVRRVAALHQGEADGRPSPRADWTAARRAAQAVVHSTSTPLTHDHAVDGHDAVQEFASDAAWSCATSRSVATQCWRVWTTRLATLPVQARLGHGKVEMAEFERLRDAFWRDTAALRPEVNTAGASPGAYDALFTARYPEATRRQRAYGEQAAQAMRQSATLAADRLLALLRAANPA